MDQFQVYRMWGRVTISGAFAVDQVGLHCGVASCCGSVGDCGHHFALHL